MADRFLIAVDDAKFGAWLRHSLEAGWPAASLRVMDLNELRRVRAGITVRDYDLALVGLTFGETPEDTESGGLDWLRKLKNQPAFPELIVLAEGGSELTAVRAIRLGVLDYLPKRLLTPFRMQNAVRLALRAIQRERQSRQDRRTQQQPSVVAVAAIAPDKPGAVPPAPVDQVAPPDGAIAARAAVADAGGLPGYTILQQLGESDAAAVYLAMSAALERKVALKISKRVRDEPGPAGENDDSVTVDRALFEREYHALATVHDTSVVQIFDYGTHAGREYLAMEYFPCGDLKARLQHPISLDEALAFVRDIASALNVVHAAGIVHRDLKPPNVMLREDGSVVLIDFGLARNLLAGDGTTRTGVLRGSPYYMSPEQAQGNNLDPRTDLYSLGVIFYEMLAGKKPHLGASAMDVLRQHVDAPVPLLPVEFAHWQWLLDRLMAKDRDERFESANAVLEALDRAQTGEPAAEPVIQATAPDNDQPAVASVVN
ncbi:MAG: protein kinase [Steroidobacteraceae bacterium]